jgi:hypothetical protein
MSPNEIINHNNTFFITSHKQNYQIPGPGLQLSGVSGNSYYQKIQNAYNAKAGTPY